MVQRRLKITDLVWLAWLAFAVFLTWPGMKWEIEYFDNPQPYYYRAFIVLLAASPLLLYLGARLRRRILRRDELTVFAGIVLAICAAYEPRGTLIAVLVFAASFALGRRVTRTLAIKTSGAVEGIAVSTATGLGLLHCALFPIGLMGGYVWPVFLVLIGIPLLLCFRELRGLYESARHIDAVWAGDTEARSWPGTLLFASALLWVVTTVTYALAPSVYYDILNLHLPVIRYFASHHTLSVPPTALAYAYYPQGVETVMTLGYSLGGQPAAQLLPEVYFFIAMLLLFSIGRQCGMDRFSAAAGIVFAVSMPAMHWTGSSGKDDLGLAMFLFGALLGFLRWRETKQWRWILLGAFFLAMAAGVKHIVLFAIPPLLVLFAYAAWRQSHRTIAFLQLVGVLLIFSLFWHVRAWVATGNPLYPSAPATPAGSFVPAAHASSLRDKVWQYVLFPWKLHFRGRTYYESVSDYPMGIVLVLFAPVWLLVRKRLNTAALVSLAFCASYVWYWAVAVGMIRYALAPIAIVFALTAWRVMDFSRAAPRLIKLSVFAACFYALLFSLCGIAINEITAPQIRYFAKIIDRKEYLREALPFFRALEFVNQAVKPGDAVYSIGACATAYLAENTVTNCTLLIQQISGQDPRASLSRGNYRFLIAPRSPVLDLPPGWVARYADENFRVLYRGLDFSRSQ